MTAGSSDRPQKLSEGELDAISGGATRKAHDHLTDHNWMIEIEGVAQGSFQDASGLLTDIN